MVPGLREPTADSAPDAYPELDDAAPFGPVSRRRHTFDVTFTADRYRELLSTFSVNLALPDENRDGLFGLPRRADRRPVRRHDHQALPGAARRGPRAADIWFHVKHGYSVGRTAPVAAPSSRRSRSVSMTTGQIRPFRRSDRDQVTALVNAHAQAVVPGVSVSVNAVLSHLEREPGEFLVDPWVRERVTLVAEQRGRISAVAHLVRYGTEPDVGPAMRDTARDPVAAPLAGPADLAGRIRSGSRRGRGRGRGSPPLEGTAYGGRPRLCRRPGSTASPSSGRTSARCWSGSASSGAPAPSSCTWPTSTACPAANPVPGLEIVRTLGVAGTRFTARLGRRRRRVRRGRHRDQRCRPDRARRGLGGHREPAGRSGPPAPAASGHGCWRRSATGCAWPASRAFSTTPPRTRPTTSRSWSATDSACSRGRTESGSCLADSKAR